MDNMTPIELYWDSQKNTLKDVHKTFSPDHQYKPLPERHPLLHRRNHSQLDKRNKHLKLSMPKEEHIHDSWEEYSEESDNDSDVFPYPMVMYPMIVAPHPNVSSQKFKNHKYIQGSRKKLKKVHYRNTPTFLNSRENTKHEPRERDMLRKQKETDVRSSDPFDPRSNSVLARYQVDNVPDYYPYRISSDTKFIQPVSDNTYNIENARQQSISPDIMRTIPVSEYVADFVEDAIVPEIDIIVKDTTQELVSEHMENAAAYDNILDMTDKIVEEVGPQLIEECILDVVIEDVVNEVIIEEAIFNESKDIAIEVLSYYSDKVRERDIREINQKTSVKLQDSMCVDYLLAQICRQGELWTEGEHANKLLDEMMLTIVTSEYFNVAEKRRKTMSNKPLRRYYEKLITDVVFDKLLEELSLNLDEDMAELDEYERGVDTSPKNI